uniref:uncharacterized protein sowahb n=1 Tax=Monopterus albus TaxID=43700 RepID=UPI0009B2E8F8|nr:uncharacterized protein LOC109960794 [Monopterus albus]
MSTDFTQDSVLHFLQSSGGSVKNSDLLLHFRSFIRDHADRDRNRELFKKFVNSVAIVRQENGVSYVVLKKKFRGQAPGDGVVGSTGPPRLPADKKTEPYTESTNLSPAASAEKARLRKLQPWEVSSALSGETASKTILPAAGILLNNKVETNFNLKRQQQVKSTSELSGRPGAAAAQVVCQVSEKAERETPRMTEPAARDQCTALGQQRGGYVPLPGVTPVVPAVRHLGETSQQVPVPQILEGREACLQSEGRLHQGVPLHHVSLDPQVTPRRVRHRASYKSAVSFDEEEEEDEVPVRPGSAGGEWPLSDPLGDTVKTIFTSSPCVIESPAPPSVVSSSSSSSSERKVPMIFVQNVEEEALPPGGPRSFEEGVGLRGHWAGSELEPMYVSGESVTTRGSLPLDRTKDPVPPGDIHQDRQNSQPPVVQPGPWQGLHQNQRAWLSSSQGSLFSPSSDAGFSSSGWPPSGSSRGSGQNSSYEDVRVKAGKTGRVDKVQEVLQRAQRTKLVSMTHEDSKLAASPWHHSTGNIYDDQEPTARLQPFHQSMDHLHVDQYSTTHVLPWHLSTDELSDNHEEEELSEGSTSTPQLRQRPAVTRRLSSHLRNRMCRSLGADLDQIVQEEVMGGGGGSEVARLNRLHLISSSLSLRTNLSSSSLSSCSTPPHNHSFAELVEGADRRAGRRSLPSTGHTEGTSRQSSVPLETREHAWLVKGAAGSWTDIYALFREDSSLLNRHDFISGFTVLHWIAKHGDHRVLNTLWYGVEKSGLTFDINARSTCGHTPLHIAAIHGNKNIMRLLVAKFNADVKLRDIAGKKPWQYLSPTIPPDMFELLGAPARAALGEVGTVDHGWVQQQQQRRRLRHNISSASSGQRPLTVAGTTKVKRSSSIAAFLKHKSLQLQAFQGHQSDSSV